MAESGNTRAVGPELVITQPGKRRRPQVGDLEGRDDLPKWLG